MRKLLITIIGLFILPLSLFAAGEQIVDIDIEGMSCEFCAHSVQKKFNKLPGDEKANVNIGDKKAHIVMLPGEQVDIELLKKNQ